MSAPTYPIELRIVEAKGTCAACHSLGDTFSIPGTTERFACDSLCIHALYSMLPKIIALRYGGTFPWTHDEPDVVRHACPDATNVRVFEIRRMRLEP